MRVWKFFNITIGKTWMCKIFSFLHFETPASIGDLNWKILYKITFTKCSELLSRFNAVYSNKMNKFLMGLIYKIQFWVEVTTQKTKPCEKKKLPWLVKYYFLLVLQSISSKWVGGPKVKTSQFANDFLPAHSKR